jgi:hypothetical protein
MRRAFPQTNPARIAPFAVLLALAGCGSSGLPGVTTPPQAGADDTFDRTIDLADADGPLPLDTTDDAARAAIGARLFYSSVLDTLAAKRGAAAKAETENCSDGGTRTREESTTYRSVRYDECLEGFRFTDGFLEAEITSAGYPWSDARAQIGENGETLLAENRDPANDFRSLQLGTLTGEVKVNFDGDVEEVVADVDLVGAQSDLDDTPRMNYGMDHDRIQVKFDGDDLLINESGPFRLSGDCGVGRASVATIRDLRVHREGGAVVDGQLALSNDIGRSASVVYNADQTVDVSVADASQRYTLTELRDLCPM